MSFYILKRRSHEKANVRSPGPWRLGCGDSLPTGTTEDKQTQVMQNVLAGQTTVYPIRHDVIARKMHLGLSIHCLEIGGTILYNLHGRGFLSGCASFIAYELNPCHCDPSIAVYVFVSTL